MKKIIYMLLLFIFSGNLLYGQFTEETASTNLRRAYTAIGSNHLFPLY